MMASSWSRHGQILEISDVSKKEALEYLEHRKVNKKDAMDIYELVGGRMIDLNFTANEVKRRKFSGMYGRSIQKPVLDSHYFTDIQQSMFSDAEGQLKIAGIFPGLRYHKQGAAVISKLLEKGSISEKEYDSLTGPEIGDKLLAANIFAFHFDSRRITFQSTLMKRCCEKAISWWK